MGIVVGTAFAFGTYQYWKRDRVLSEHGRETTATVAGTSGSGNGRRVIVELTAVED
jgi:hypothetical protein